MAAAFEIPLSPSPQKLHIALSGTDYTIWLAWNTVSNLWVLDIGDTNETMLLSGIPLVTGADLLAQHKYIGIAGGLAVATDGNPDEPPSFQTLGIHSHLYYII
jgi:hypothetical protein